MQAEGKNRAGKRDVLRVEIDVSVALAEDVPLRERAVEQFSDPRTFHTFEDVFGELPPQVHPWGRTGLYAFRATAKGYRDLRSALGRALPSDILYVGMSGRTGTRGGKLPQALLSWRVWHHYAGESSFAGTLALIFRRPGAGGELRVSGTRAWMKETMLVSACVATGYAHDSDLVVSEEAVLKRLRPCLNIPGNPDPEIRRMLRSLRG